MTTVSEEEETGTNFLLEQEELPFLSPTRVPGSALTFKQDDFALDLDAIEDQQLIAEGAFGQVQRCRYKGQFCAVKVLEGVNHSSTDWLTELTILKNYSDHPNIISFLGAAKLKQTCNEAKTNTIKDEKTSSREEKLSDDSNQSAIVENDEFDEHREQEASFSIYILTTYALFGDLRRFWRNSPHLAVEKLTQGGWNLVIRLLIGVNDGLQFLHARHVIHRDIKASKKLLCFY